MQRPTGVTAIAVIFLLIAAHLGGIGIGMIVSPGAVSMIRGAPLLHGLELGGPDAALLVGAVWALIGLGLFRLHDWARLAAMLVIISGVGMVWYLFRTPIAEQFSKAARAT
jgi:hypothetical protein